MRDWGPVIATLAVNLLAVAFFYGSLWRASREHDKAFEKVDGKFLEVQAEQNNQWAHINDTRADVARIKGKLGINGSAG